MELSQDKRCKRCAEVYPRTTEYFYRNKSNADGLSAYCKTCTKADNQARWDAKGDQYREINRRWREAPENRERQRELAAQHYEANREEYIARANAWNRAHPQERTALNKKHQRERRLKLKIAGTVTTTEWEALLEYYGHRCLRCGRTGVELTQDHVLPLSMGGSHTVDNLQPLCRSCNSSKKDRHIDYR